MDWGVRALIRQTGSQRSRPGEEDVSRPLSRTLRAGWMTPRADVWEDGGTISAIAVVSLHLGRQQVADPVFLKARDQGELRTVSLLS